MDIEKDFKKLAENARTLMRLEGTINPITILIVLRGLDGRTLPKPMALPVTASTALKTPQERAIFASKVALLGQRLLAIAYFHVESGGGVMVKGTEEQKKEKLDRIARLWGGREEEHPDWQEQVKAHYTYVEGDLEDPEAVVHRESLVARVERDKEQRVAYVWPFEVTESQAELVENVISTLEQT